MPEQSTPEPIYNINLHLSPNQPVVCIHHSDGDGVVSALVLKTYFNNVWFIGTNYGKKINYDQINPGSIVFLLDFTLPVDEMRMLAKYNTLIFIDHHMTPFEKEYEEFRNLEGIRSVEAAGCKLTWMYLHPNETCPRSISLVSDYDTWKFSDPDTLAFHYGMELFNINPRQTSDVFIRKFLYNEEFINCIVDMGKRIDRYTEHRNELLSKDAAFITELNGHKVLVMNIRNTNSKVLDYAAKQHPEIKLRSTFGYNSSIGKYKCSLYSDDENLVCQDIDPRFKGHKSAAGMECEFSELPYKLPTHSLKEPVCPDFVTELNNLCNADPVIYKHDASSLGYLCKLNGFPGKFEGMDAFIINHPFWTGAAMYTTTMITDYQVVVFWNLVSSGWYRYRIYPLEKKRLELKELEARILGGKIVGDAVWCYRDAPIENPNPPQDFKNKYFGTKRY